MYAYVRREPLVSSQIEGTQSSLSDLLLFELDQEPGVPFDDVVEVSNYIAALERFIHDEQLPFSALIVEHVLPPQAARVAEVGEEPAAAC